MSLWLGTVGSSLLKTTSTFDHISTSTVGSSGSSMIEFANIPNTYQHLQIRMTARTTSVSTGSDNVYLVFNNDTGLNYTYHVFQGNGSSVIGYSAISQPSSLSGLALRDGNLSLSYSVCTSEILDYNSSTKTKTVKIFSGDDKNGTGFCMARSSLWNSISPIISIKILPEANNFKQYSKFSLYGIK